MQSNKTGLSTRNAAIIAAAAAVAALAPGASATVLQQEGFDYTVGARLIGQTNPGNSRVWGDPSLPAQPAAGVDTQLITAGSLSFPGLPAPAGNSVIIPNDINSNIARLDFTASQSIGTAPNGLFMSFAMTLSGFDSLPAGTGSTQAGGTAAQNGAFVAGFHSGWNQNNDTMNTGNRYGAMIRIRREVDANNAETGFYQFGVIKNNVAGFQYAWDTTRHYAPGETVFVVAQYRFVTGDPANPSATSGNNDEALLWVNPTPGAAAPAATVSNSVGPDMTFTSGTGSGTNWFYVSKSTYFRSDPNAPGDLTVDEMRVATSYAEVTPAAPTYYWDVDGATPGAGGTAPAGSWDGLASNFNSDSAGGSGTLTASPTPDDIVNFAAGTGATGAYTVTVSGTRTAAVANFNQGDVTLDGGSLAVGRFDVAAGASGTVLSALTGFGTGVGAGSVTKTGAGTLTLSGVNTHTGGTFVYEGTLVAANADALAAGNLSVSTGATARLHSGLPKAATVARLDIVGTGKLDITDNSMVIKNMTAAQVQAQLTAGYNAGAWNGTGIVSSSAAASTETSVGYASNASLGLTEFKGVSGLDSDDVLVKYTYAGDANLDGKVDIGDLGLLAGAWQQLTGKVWFDGDFTYDGAVNIGDLGLLAGNWQKGTAGNPSGPLMDFNTALAQFSAFEGVVVPEPTGLALLGAVGAGLLARRRCRA